ncbi:hypothetical protein GOBAR_AA33601 [Gossypium barbadense]|uniref:Uncharacterized protein n=1 Tax=Gossypium barbadense TaxID=3634 RepID=A0A2P5W7Q6_GOSBA|nr:hypothetical protein GOBAR_AA33601 [Gossypium barbadense]
MGEENKTRNLPHKLVDTGDRPVLVYDGFLRWALEVAKQFGILSAVFFTQSCAINNVYYHLPLLPEVNVSLPRLPLLQVSELPSFISGGGLDVKFWNVMYLDKRLDDDKHYGMNLFNPETDACRSWLNGKLNGSVVYASFESLASPEANQMQELALALKGKETKEKGLVVTWCINSSLGVPMLGMLFWTDQITNAKLVVDRLRMITTKWCLNELVNGEKGKEIKMNTIKLKNLVKKMVEEGGILDKNNDEFIAKLLEN